MRNHFSLLHNCAHMHLLLMKPRSLLPLLSLVDGTPALQTSVKSVFQSQEHMGRYIKPQRHPICVPVAHIADTT